MLLQLPPNLLNQVLSYLDPIWLFQLELTCTCLASHLRGTFANQVWYTIIPSPLLTTPEHFQDEKVLVMTLKALVATEGYRSTFKLTSSEDNVKELDGEVRSLPAFRSPDSLVVLPKLGNLSALSHDTELYDTQHLTTSAYYPLLRSPSGMIRKRNLAIGGLYQPELSYRRELLGHLHHKQRCWLCFEQFRDGRRQQQEVFDLLVCRTCSDPLAVPYAVVKRYSIFSRLVSIQHMAEGVWETARTKDANKVGFWIHQVDDVLRTKTGIDYRTAVAKEKYVLQLRYAGKFGSVINQKRQKLRLEIIGIAEKLWSDGAFKGLEAKDHEKVGMMRETYAPASRLHEFLFDPRLLDADAAYLPSDDKKKWIPDPADIDTNELELVLGDDVWKTSQATDMLRGIVAATMVPSREITAVSDAAEAWHRERLEKLLSVDTAKEQIKTHTRHRHGWHRTKTLLSKLHLVPDGTTHGVELTPEGLAAATQVFPKILGRVCMTCPVSGLLTPRGIPGLTKHMREVHPDHFWGWKKESGGRWWTVQG